MIEQDIPGFGMLRIERVLLDYNGTLALDGEPLPAALAAIEPLAARVEVRVVTADTYGTVRSKLAGICDVEVLPRAAAPGDEGRSKLDIVTRSGAGTTAFVGNGANDASALAAARLGIAVVGPEGAASSALAAARVVCPDIDAALGLLLTPQRLRATLRC